MTNLAIRRILKAGRPKGMAVLLVLGLLAVTLAVSYATLRGQGTTTQLARNSSRALDAREAARSGLAAALRKMSEGSWGGVGAPISSNVTNNSWYNVAFTTGDTKLTPGSSLFAEYPFRVTIESTGTASDPTNASVRASYRARCIVQLVRRSLRTEPSNWTTLTNYSVYQWGNRNVLVQPPVRINGPANILGKVLLCQEYPQPTGVINQYLSDLNLRILAGNPDYRPFSSPLTIATSRQDATNTTRLTTRLGLVLLDNTASTANPLSHPGTVTTYKLYPGGKDYTVPVLQNSYGSTLQNVTLGADQVSNPLGIYRCSGALTLQNNVTINGTIITDGSSPEIQISGTGVNLQAANLPALNGNSQVYQLPVLLSSDNVRINSNSGSQINGFAMVWNEFEIKQGSPTTALSVTGNLVTSGLTLRGRDSWVMDSTQWNNWKTGFDWNLINLSGSSRIAFFPDFMEVWKGFTVKPTLTFQPASGGVKPHWHDWSQPVYQKGSADSGLVWDVVRWEEDT